MRNRERRTSKLRIGLKYCGGCRSQYNRVAVVAELKNRLKSLADFVSYEEPEIDGYLIVVGCSTACVDQTPFTGKPIWVIGAPEEAEPVLKSIIIKLEVRDALERTL